jgi:hypothetical protein
MKTLAALCALPLLVLVSSTANARIMQDAAPVAVTEAVPETVPAALAPAPVAQEIKIPEGTELQIRIDEKLSSASALEDDKFAISLEEDLTIAGVKIPAGYRGRGLVQSAKKRRMMGQAGQLNIALDYIKIGDTKIRVRANKGKEGEGHMGATVALTVLFGPLGLLKHGDDVVITAGTVITGYVAEDVVVPLPLADAPPSNN